MTLRRITFIIPLIVLALAFTTSVHNATAAVCSAIEAQSRCDQPFPPPTFTTPQPRADSIVEGVRYGWIDDYAAFYAEPDRNSDRTHYASGGLLYGPATDTATDAEGNEWVHVWGHWLPAHRFHPVEPSTFTGVEVNATPQRPFGWILHPFQPRPEPGAAPADDAPELQRYHFVEVYASTLGPDGAIWHDIGDGQWIRYHAVALLINQQRPQGIDPHEYWVDVDLYQQTFAAYEGDRIVFAGLISSGLPEWPTRRGLFSVYSRYVTSPMAGGEVGYDYYYLEDVTHSLYYDRLIALHGAYWHDDFGRPKSHGCVNIPPIAAEWLYLWAEKAPGDLRVRVHNTIYSDFL